MRDLQAIARNVEGDWTNERADRVRSGIARKAARRRAGTFALGAVATAALAVFGARILSHPTTGTVSVVETPVLAVAPAIPAETRKTTATPLSNDTNIVASSERAYVVESGGARFVVAHDVEHPFTVRAGDVLVEDVGTVFTVTLSGDKVDVVVTEGTVRVNHDGVASNLGAGEHLEVAAHEKIVTAKAAPERARPVVRDEVAPLLRAADDARAAGHPESALDPLRRVIDEHSADSRAGLAAFTLGRILLDELARPKEAADAFAIARAHGGPMSRDALGREVVARARAGEKTRASELGAEYLRLYPSGDRAKEVERITGKSP